jgi:hypothetical protein
MAIQSSDILFKLSTTAGSAGNSGAQADINASLGKYISTTQIAGTLHNLFDRVTGDENAANGTGVGIEYRCIFIHNAHASLPLQLPVIWIYSEVSGGCNIRIGLDTTAQSLIGSASAQALTIADVNTAPAGVSFTAPTTKGTGISLGATLDAGKCIAVWVERKTTNSAAKDADGVTLKVEGDSAE